MAKSKPNRELIRALMGKRQPLPSRPWLAPMQIQEQLAELGRPTTAHLEKMRDLRKAKYGGHTIELRPKPGRAASSQAMEYRLTCMCEKCRPKTKEIEEPGAGDRTAVPSMGADSVRQTEELAGELRTVKEPAQKRQGATSLKAATDSRPATLPRPGFLFDPGQNPKWRHHA